MKDSNAAPSLPNTPSPSATRGKVSTPKARAKSVSKAKDRARARTAKPKNSALLASTPAATEIVASPIVTAAKQENIGAASVESAPSSEIVAPKAELLNAAAPAAKAPEVKASAAESMTPEILFPEVLTPQIVPAKTAVKSPTTAATAAKSVAAKAVAPSPAPKTAPAQPAVKAVAAPKPITQTKTVSAPVAPVISGKRALPKFQPLYIFAALAALILTTAGGVAVGSYNNWSNSDIIAPKVRIAGESIGGMTRQQAVSHLNKRFEKLAFTLQTDDKKVVLGLKDIGGKPSIGPTVDKAFAIGRSGGVVDNLARVFGAEVKPRTFSLPIEWNRGALTSRLQIVNDQYEIPAVDARLVTVSGGSPRVSGEESGRALDVSATADAIEKSYYLGLGKIPAITSAVEPKILAADLAGRDVKMGEYRTTYNGGIAGRTTNIHVACRAIDGTVLMPGEVLSFNELTGERTYKKGYRMAHIFMREAGQTESSIVDGLAGGVCQVSSTLYNAVRKTNLAATGKPLGIVERSSHSLPVTYVPSGRDATVAWPSKDFKFRNDQNFPVYVRTKVGDGRLTVTIWGRVPQDQVVPVSLEN